MQIQNAPQSVDSKTVLIAWRDSGGFWSSTIVDVGEPWSISDLAHASAVAEMHDEYYYEHAAKEITYQEAKEIVRRRKATHSGTPNQA